MFRLYNAMSKKILSYILTALILLGANACESHKSKGDIPDTQSASLSAAFTFEGMDGGDFQPAAGMIAYVYTNALTSTFVKQNLLMAGLTTSGWTLTPDLQIYNGDRLQVYGVSPSNMLNKNFKSVTVNLKEQTMVYYTPKAVIADYTNHKVKLEMKHLLGALNVTIAAPQGTKITEVGVASGALPSELSLNLYADEVTVRKTEAIVRTANITVGDTNTAECPTLWLYPFDDATQFTLTVTADGRQRTAIVTGISLEAGKTTQLALNLADMD